MSKSSQVNKSGVNVTCMFSHFRETQFRGRFKRIQLNGIQIRRRGFRVIVILLVESAEKVLDVRVGRVEFRSFLEILKRRVILSERFFQET